jgi:hypothetical protein
VLFYEKFGLDVDDTGDLLVQSLLLSRRVTKLGYVRGREATQRDAPRRNLTGDPYVTDGLQAVLVFSKEITSLLQLQTLPWEWPSSLMFDGGMPWRSAD